MKHSLHPNWNNDATVTCACGHSFTTGSTNTSLTVDICSACHPYFTGEMKFVDTQGRVDKFMQKMAAAKSKAGTNQKAATKPSGPQKSYKQLLQEQKDSLKKTKPEQAS